MTAVSDERAIWLGRHVLPHEPALRAWLQSRRIGGLEVDDVIQETYTRFITMETVSNIQNAKSYAFQTAASVVADHLRRKKVVSISSVTDLDYLGIMSDEPSPEDQLADRDELNRLAMALAALPDRVREVFTLRRVHGLSQREVAEKMGIAESTVEKHLSRGFLLLLELFPYGGKPVSDTSMTGSARTRPLRPHDKKDRPGD
jgi:RNA polymerase sigma-70 factor (ECF subfamily)